MEPKEFPVETLEVVESAPNDELDAGFGILARKSAVSDFVEGELPLGMESRLRDFKLTYFQVARPDAWHLWNVEVFIRLEHFTQIQCAAFFFVF